MNRTRTLLVCVFSDLSGETLHRYVCHSMLFAKQLTADIHFLVPSGTEQEVNLALKEVNHGGSQTSKTILHDVGEEVSDESVNDAIKSYLCDLVIMPSGSISSEYGCVSLLKRLSVPILFLSPKVDFFKVPIDTVIIPMSGEIHVSSALKFGLELASRIRVPIDLVHVFKLGNQTECSLNALGDQPHHEYQLLLERVLAEASPFSNTKERAQVRKLYQVRGIPSTEILKIAKDNPSCALIAEWHGSLTPGKAEIFKNILQESEIPIFAVKTEADQKSVLKIGPENRVA